MEPIQSTNHQIIHDLESWRKYFILDLACVCHNLYRTYENMMLLVPLEQLI